MNIRELLDWRSNCFFCQDELVIIPNMGGAIATYKIEDDWLFLESTFVNLAINVLDGTIKEIDNSDKVTVDEYIKRMNFIISFKCSSCLSNKHYSYQGKVNINNNQQLAQVSALTETLYIVDKWIYTQSKLYENESGQLKSWKLLNNDQRAIPNAVDRKGELVINTPFINLNNTTPEKLDNKLRTIMVFS